MDIISKADQCVSSEMIAWVSYPDLKKFCFVYPRLLIDSNKWKKIDANAFPNNGSLFVKITGGSDSSEIHSSFGSIVIIKVNAKQFQESSSYESLDSNSNLYSLSFNPTFKKGYSDLEFELFSEHSASEELIQIVDIKEDVAFYHPFEESVRINGDTNNLVCKLILVRSGSGKCYGPFGYTKRDGHSIFISALASRDYRIARFESVSKDCILGVFDGEESNCLQFIEKNTIEKMYADAKFSGETIDWLPQSELIEVIIRAINASDEFNAINKNQLRNIKIAIRNYNENTNSFRFDENRKQRVIDWLSQIDKLIELPSQFLDDVIDSFPDDKIIELVQNDKYFPKFKDKIIESSGIQEMVAEERIKLETSLDDIKRQCDEAEEKKEIAKREASAAKEKAVEASRQLEKVQSEALEQKRDELDDLDIKINDRKKSIEQLDKEYERAIVSKNKIEKDVEEIISGINDEVTASTKILESEILRKVVAAVSGVDLRETDQDSIKDYAALKDNENTISDDEIVDYLYDSITRRAGRQIAKNDMINYMICLSQGYITTFAGQPGTGKTSLCNILARVLGLINKNEGKRFNEINVENGWTSYKDYIGYYNPLVKSYEKSNVTVYDAMRLLSKENGKSGEVPPYIFLLDEANLSPIEHYWSPFLRACDNFLDDGTSISLGGTEEWKLPKHVRFLATVNFDHTTEALSHRFLDRSWIITLDPNFVDFNPTRINLNKEFENETAFSSERLFGAFGYKGEMADQENIQLLDELIRTCRQHALPISPRSQLMMRRYIATASRLMNLQSKDAQYAPLDYAFSQKVLPQITGTAEMVGKLVEALSDKCSPLKTSKKQLDRMREFGKDSGFYQYFV